MYEFNIGDRVVSTVSRPSGNQTIVVGFAGTVCTIRDGIGVRWDEPIEGGHTCYSGGETHCEDGYGWWVREDQIEPEPDDSLVFEFDEAEFKKLVFGEG